MPREDTGERHLDVAVQRLGAALAHAVEQRVAQAQRDGRVADEPRRLLFRLRLGDRLDRVLASELVEQVLAPGRVDQVGEDHRVVGGLDSQGLRVVRDERPLEPLRSRRDDDLVGKGERETPVVCGDTHQILCGRLRSLPPDDCSAGRDALARRDRLVELVDPSEQRPELELSEGLAQLGAVGRREDELGRISVDVEIAAHRREHLRRARLVRELRQVLPARGRELIDVLEHLLERPVLRHELPRRLVTDPWDARDVVGTVALEPDEVGDLVGPDPVARLDALGRVDVHVADAARRHHQANVLGDELERVAVGRDDARLDPLLVGACREGRDHVVGLPALELEIAVAERLDDRPQVGELLAEQVRHRPAALLVDDLDGLRLRGAVHWTRVPRDRDALRPVVGEQLEEHVGEAEQRVGREALTGRELLGQREERAVGEVVAVDEEKLGVARGGVVQVELGAGEGLRRHLCECTAR